MIHDAVENTGSRSLHFISVTGILLLMSMAICTYRYIIPTVPNISTLAASTTVTLKDQQQPLFSMNITERIRVKRVDHRGSWLGDNWVPPSPWKVLSAEEMREVYKGRSMVWIGDSTARRAATMIYTIVNDKGHSVSKASIDTLSSLNLNKKLITEPCRLAQTNHTEIRMCRRIAPDNSLWAYAKALCLTDILEYAKQEIAGSSNMSARADLLIVGMGIWEISQPDFCRNFATDYSEKLDEKLAIIAPEIISSLVELSEKFGVQIIWRTSGFLEHRTKAHVTLHLNQVFMDLLDEVDHPNVSYVDWGAAVFDRSFGRVRISGDGKSHYGLGARIAELQLVTNQIKDMNLK
jgi:hypothetical protein